MYSIRRNSLFFMKKNSRITNVYAIYYTMQRGLSSKIVGVLLKKILGQIGTQPEHILIKGSRPKGESLNSHRFSQKLEQIELLIKERNRVGGQTRASF